MAVTSYLPDVGDQLDNVFKPEYLFHQEYPPDDFMRLLVPSETYYDQDDNIQPIQDKFFGVKSYNIFIAQKAYGWQKNEAGDWVFVWSDSGSEFSTNLQIHIDRWLKYGQHRFPYFKCLIFVDMYTANLVKAEDPDSRLPDYLAQTASKLEELCNTLPGFEYGGLLEERKESSFFEEKIQAFYGEPLYKVPQNV